MKDDIATRATGSISSTQFDKNQLAKDIMFKFQYTNNGALKDKIKSI